MNRPMILRSARSRPGAQKAARPQTVAPESRGSSLTTILIWVQMIILVVPSVYLMGGTDLAAGEVLNAPNPLLRTFKLGLMAFSAFIIFSKARLSMAVCKSINPFFIVFMAVVPLSVLWSIEPAATLNHYISIVSIVLVCLAFTLIGWNRTRFQSVMRPVIATLLIASVIWAVVYPQYGIEVGEGTLLNSWRGLTSQKNQFGMLASFGVVLWLHAWFNKEKPWWVAFPFIALSFTCVLLSRSSTSLMATSLSTVFMLLVMVSPSSFRRFMPYVVSAFATLVVVYALAVLNLIPGMSMLLTPIASLTGKDMTFSNRAVIWDIIKEHIQLAPFLGSGYAAYWTGPVPTSPSYVFLGRMYFYPTESHNGYLEIVNDLGFLGLIVLLGYLLFWVRQSLRLMKVDRGQGMLFLAIFFQQGITNLSESTWFAINSAFAIAFVTLATFCLGRSLLASLQSYSPRLTAKRR